MSDTPENWPYHSHDEPYRCELCDLIPYECQCPNGPWLDVDDGVQWLLGEHNLLTVEIELAHLRIGKLLTVFYSADAFMRCPAENHEELSKLAETLQEAIDIVADRHDPFDDLIASGGYPEAQALQTKGKILGMDVTVIETDSDDAVFVQDCKVVGRIVPGKACYCPATMEDGPVRFKCIGEDTPGCKKSQSGKDSDDLRQPSPLKTVDSFTSDSVSGKVTQPMVVGVDYGGKDESTTVYRCTGCGLIFDEESDALSHQCELGKESL